jgi:hypothetical protein
MRQGGILAEKLAACVALCAQIPYELLTWRLERDKSVADGLLEVAKLKEADTLVIGISGYR